MQTLTIRSQEQDQFIDITQQIEAAVRQAGLASGIVIAYVPHTTAGITINESADPSVAHDIQQDLSRLVPRRQSYYRHGESNSSSHTRSTLIGSSVTLLIDGGKLVLGTWQGVFFCEFDGPRSRKVRLQWMAA